MTNGSDLNADLALADRLAENDVEVVTDSIDRTVGDDSLDGVVLESDERIDVDGLFVALGAAGGTEFAEALGIPTEGPYLEVDPDQGTAVERVYAAGDVTGGNRQVTVSVGEGADAAINLLVAFRGTDYVDHRKSTTE